MTQLEAQLRTIAHTTELDGFGVASAEPFEAAERTLRERKSGGLSGKLAFTYRDPDTSSNVRRSFPWATSLVVAAKSYLPEAGSPGSTEQASGRVARFATRDHYEPLRHGLETMAAHLQSQGHQTAVLADDSRLIDRAAAVRAGIGWWGKSTMVISPKYGPWLLLGSVVTDAVLAPSEPMRRDCGKCVACLPACPTGALITPGVLDATLCLAYWTRTPGVIPRELRVPWGDRIYGCDDCLEACPPGHSALESGKSRAGSLDLVELLSADDETLLEGSEHWFIPRRDPDYIRRNALIALGNTGGPEHVALIEKYLHHRRATLRAHAAWALGRIGTSGVDALEARRELEHDPQVLDEIESALPHTP